MPGQATGSAGHDEGGESVAEDRKASAAMRTRWLGAPDHEPKRELAIRPQNHKVAQSRAKHSHRTKLVAQIDQTGESGCGRRW